MIEGSVINTNMTIKQIENYARTNPNTSYWFCGISMFLDELSDDFIREFQDKIGWENELVHRYVMKHKERFKEYLHYYDV